jgi:hypothetical protein
MQKIKSLRLAGIFSCLIALFQVVLAFSTSWCRSFGAPEFVLSSLPILITSCVIASTLFIVFGLYGFSGAGDIRRLPLLRTGLLVIGSGFTYRGLVVIRQLLIVIGYYQSKKVVTPEALCSSIVFLIIGLTYLYGTISNWKKLKRV